MHSCSSTKRCPGCGLTKDRTEFHRSKGNADGLQSECKTCMLARRAAWYGQPEVRARLLADRRAEYQVNQTERVRKAKERYWADPDHCNAIARRSILKKKYGLTSDEFDGMVWLQDNRCAICGDPPTSSSKDVLHIDHDHESGRVRQLLCSPCNKGLGHFHDSPELLRAAAGYIEAHQTVGVA